MKRLFLLLACLLLSAVQISAQGTVPVTQTLFTGTISATSAACATANSCAWIKLQLDSGTVAVTISGTFSATLLVEASADGGSTFTTLATFTTVQTAVPISSAGMTDFRIRASAYVSGTASVTLSASRAANEPTPTLPGNASNACLNPSAVLLTANGTTSGTAAVQIVALTAGLKIYVCSLSVVGQSGTTPTFSLEYGTGAACAGSPVVVIPAFATPANTMFNFSPPVTATAVSNALCYIQTGTTPVSVFALTYVQQ